MVNYLEIKSTVDAIEAYPTFFRHTDTADTAIILFTFGIVDTT